MFKHSATDPFYSTVQVNSPSGRRQVLIEFAGLAFIFSGLNLQQGRALMARFGGPAAERQKSTHPPIPVELQYAQFSSPPIASLLGVQGEYMPRVENQPNAILVQGHDFVARIVKSCGLSGTLEVRNPESLTFPVVENLLRILTAYAVLEQGGLFLHSAGVVVDQRAMIFLGRSAFGKSTLSRLALNSGAAVLSDDANIVLPAGPARFKASRVPFAGELGQAVRSNDEAYEIVGMFWLGRDEPEGLRPMSAGLQAARLMSCASVANVDPKVFDQLSSVVDDMLRVLPMRVLGFRKDSDFNQLYKLMQSDLS